MLNDSFTDIFLRDFWCVLRGDQDSVNPFGFSKCVFNRNLTLAIGA